MDVVEEKVSAYERIEPKQRAFVDAYFVMGFNATQAAIKAGYSKKTARQLGSQLLANLNIKAAIAEQMAKYAMPKEEVLARIGAIARSDIAEVRDLEFAENNGTSFLIKSYSTSAMGGERLEMYSALDALNTLLKQYEKVTNINFNVDMDKLTDEQLERLANGEELLSVLRS